MPDSAVDAGWHVLPVREEMDEHDVHMPRDLRELLPELPYIAIGDGLGDLAFDDIDIGGELGRRQVAAQQNLVAHDDALDRVLVSPGEGDALRDLARVL